MLRKIFKKDKTPNQNPEENDKKVIQRIQIHLA